MAQLVIPVAAGYLVGFISATIILALMSANDDN